MSVRGRNSGLSKARLVCCLIFGVVALAPATAAAKHPAPAPARLDAVTATGSGTTFTNVNITARSGPAGENPTGTVFYAAPGGTFPSFGSVTCLAVIGTTAIINFRDDGFFNPNIVTLVLTDNGGNGQDTMSLYTQPTGCAPPVFPPVVSEPLTNGRITVADAPPSPTSKQQCKRGGWARFGFANKKQCFKHA
jgi:hypothetical protein